MKFADMQRQWARDRDAMFTVPDPGWHACRNALDQVFGPVRVDNLCVPGAEPGKPKWLVGAPLSELAQQKLLELGEVCFIERWDRQRWGFGPSPDYLAEIARLNRPRKNRHDPAEEYVPRVKKPKAGTLPW